MWNTQGIFSDMYVRTRRRPRNYPCIVSTSFSFSPNLSPNPPQIHAPPQNDLTSTEHLKLSYSFPHPDSPQWILLRRNEAISFYVTTSTLSSYSPWISASTRTVIRSISSYTRTELSMHVKVQMWICFCTVFLCFSTRGFV